MKKQYFLAAILAVTLSACGNSSNTTTTTRGNQLESQTPDTNTNDQIESRQTTSALNPTDQSEKERDIRITQQIRKSIVDDKGLSFEAKNVKIITINGRVTLRGAVKNLQEKDRILGLINQVANVTDIDDQLKVGN